MDTRFFCRDYTTLDKKLIKFVLYFFGVLK